MLLHILIAEKREDAGSAKRAGLVRMVAGNAILVNDRRNVAGEGRARGGLRRRLRRCSRRICQEQNAKQRAEAQ